MLEAFIYEISIWICLQTYYAIKAPYFLKFWNNNINRTCYPSLSFINALLLRSRVSLVRVRRRWLLVFNLNLVLIQYLQSITTSVTLGININLFFFKIFNPEVLKWLASLQRDVVRVEIHWLGELCIIVNTAEASSVSILIDEVTCLWS